MNTQSHKSGSLSQSSMRQQGVALIFALLVALLLAVFAAFFTYKAQQNIRLAESISERLYAGNKADNLIKKGIYAISIMGFTSIEWPETKKVYSTQFWGQPIDISSEVTVSFQDLSSKLSIIPFRPMEWRSVLQFYGKDEVTSRGIVDRVQDWVDSDNFRRIQGLERRGYQFLNKGYSPRNAHMQSVEELLFIPGFERELLDKMSDEICFWGSSQRSPLLGSEAMIRAYATPEVYASVMEQRKENSSLRTVYNELEGVDITVVNDIPSGFFRVTVEVDSENAKFTRTADVNMRGTDVMPFYVFGWQ